MFKTSDVFSLSEFQRNYSQHIERLKQTRRPEILTRNGQAVLVVQDPDAYQELLDKVEEAETVLAVHQALLESNEGQGEAIETALPRLRERLGLRRRVG